MPSIDEIINGVDITTHYLEQKNKKFKIYRHNQEVYAVRYDENTSKPSDFIHMWTSHRREDKSAPQELGAGGYGVVYQKTEDKAFKSLENNLSGEEKINFEILEQKFMLKENNMEQYFVLGLWNIKNKQNVVYNMPKETSISTDPLSIQPKFDEFILALKKLNKLDYSHPDLAAPFVFSPGNMLITEKGIRLIDLDSGLDKNNRFGKDQWIHVYNRFCPPSGDKRRVIDEWYEKNPGRTLSDNPRALLNLYNKGGISLPQSVVKEMTERHIKNTQDSVKEYPSGNKEDRKHSYEVSIDDFSSVEYKEEYKGIKGDALKRTILNELKDSLANVTAKSELKKMKKDFFNSPEMSIIDKPQDKATQKLSLLGWKTDAHRAVVEIFEGAEEKINAQEKADKSLKI